jgi:hypothetical protein
VIHIEPALPDGAATALDGAAEAVALQCLPSQLSPESRFVEGVSQGADSKEKGAEQNAGAFVYPALSRCGRRTNPDLSIGTLFVSGWQYQKHHLKASIPGAGSPHTVNQHDLITVIPVAGSFRVGVLHTLRDILFSYPLPGDTGRGWLAVAWKAPSTGRSLCFSRPKPVSLLMHQLMHNVDAQHDGHRAEHRHSQPRQPARVHLS